VFVLNGYHLFIPFQIAVREAGVPLIELQHGLIAESHPGYIFEGDPPVDHLPDHLVVFGRHFGELLEHESPRWAGRWSVGGHPWLKEKQRGVGDLADTTSGAVVLFSQSVDFVRERMRDLAIDLRARLDPSVRIILKPHPGERNVEEYYRPIVSKGVELAAPRDDSYALLRRCRVAISVYSTVAMEALAFRCNSVVLRSNSLPDDPLVDRSRSHHERRGRGRRRGDYSKWIRGPFQGGRCKPSVWGERTRSRFRALGGGGVEKLSGSDGLVLVHRATRS
jgi:hypothetical protein